MTSNLFYFLTASIIWGLTWIAIKFQLPYADSNVAVFYRFAFSSAVLFCIALVQKIPLNKYSFKQHSFFFLQGACMFCLNYLLTYQASKYASSALVALAFTSLIFLNMFGAKIFFNSPFQKQVVWGSVISLSGMGIIAFNEYQLLGVHPNSLLGFSLSLLATLFACVGNLIGSRNGKHNVSIVASNSWSMLYGSLLSLIYCLVLNKSFFVEINQTFILSFLYLTIFGTIISFGAYLKLLNNIGPSKAAFTSVISPLIAFAVATYVENFVWSLLLFSGAFLCLLGNIIALTPWNELKLKIFL